MRASRREAGVTIVEAAFAIPVLLMFVMGMLDLGLWVFNANQATNAARDGARMAIIDYQQADVEGSATWNAIVERVEEHLPGRDIAADDIEVTCVRSDGGAGCAGAHPDYDRIEVEVSWTWDLLTPIANVIGVGEGEVSGTASMTLLGKPGAAPPLSPPVSNPPSSTPSDEATTPALIGTCEVTGITVTPAAADPLIGGNPSTAINPGQDLGSLEEVVIGFTASGEGCVGLAVQLTPPPYPVQPNKVGVQSAICGSCSSEVHTWTYKSNDKVWSVGTAEVRVFNAIEDEAATFEVEPA